MCNSSSNLFQPSKTESINIIVKKFLDEARKEFFKKYISRNFEVARLSTKEKAESLYNELKLTNGAIDAITHAQIKIHSGENAIITLRNLHEKIYDQNAVFLGKKTHSTPTLHALLFSLEKNIFDPKKQPPQDQHPYAAFVDFLEKYPELKAVINEESKATYSASATKVNLPRETCDIANAPLKF